MQVQVETINPVTKKINIEIPAELVDVEIEKSFAAIQKKAKLQGFRPGKAPMALVKRTYNDAMSEDVMRRLYDTTLYKAMTDHKIEPIDTPTVDSGIVKQGTPFKYSAMVEIMPEILLRDYTGLEITKEKYVLNQDSIEAELKRMQENMGQLVPVEEGTAVENGHVVSVDYSFSVEGCPEETNSAENAEVQVGAQLLMPGFEEQLIGMKLSEAREVKVILPEAYRTPAAAGKEGVFQVTLKDIKRKELPELNDEFAQQFGDYETIEQLRSKMAEFHQKQELDRVEAELKERTVTALVAKNPLDVPNSMVKRQIEHMLDNFKNRLKSQRMSMEMMGLDDDAFRLRFADLAVEKVKGGLLLMALVEKEDISISEEEIEHKYEEMAAGNSEMLGRIKEFYSSNSNGKHSLISEMKEDKAIRFLIDNAVVTEIDAVVQKPE